MLHGASDEMAFMAPQPGQWRPVGAALRRRLGLVGDALCRGQRVFQCVDVMRDSGVVRVQLGLHGVCKHIGQRYAFGLLSAGRPNRCFGLARGRLSPCIPRHGETFQQQVAPRAKKARLERVCGHVLGRRTRSVDSAQWRRRRRL